MGKIEILKNVNRVEENKYNTIKIKISKFKFEESSDKKKLIRKKDSDVATIIGWIDGKYSESIKTTWSSILDTGNKMDDINKILTLSGIGSLRSKAMYTQIWTNSEPIDFSFNINFIADKEPVKEVMYPIRKLQSMIVPIEQTDSQTAATSAKLTQTMRDFQLPEPVIQSVDFLKQAFIDTILLPPASSTINKDMLGGKTFEGIEYVEIGKFVKLVDVVLRNVDANFEVDNADFSGIPKSASCTISLQSKNIWTSETIKNLLSSKTDLVGNMEIMNPSGILTIITDKIKEIFSK